MNVPVARSADCFSQMRRGFDSFMELFVKLKIIIYFVYWQLKILGRSNVSGIRVVRYHQSSYERASLLIF